MNFAEATACTQLEPHVYAGNFQDDWAIGSVPHGGYVLACLMTVVRAYFDSTLKAQNQPHTIALHVDFLRRTQTGPAKFRLKDVKLGRQSSIVHVTLIQDGREEVIGTFTNSNLNTEDGATYSTQWQLHPTPKPIADFSALDQDRDPDWGERPEWPFSDFRKASTKLRSWFPRRGQPGPACLDMWYCFRDPNSRFTNESIGFVCDAFPQIIETYLLDGLDPYGVNLEDRHSPVERKKIMNHKPRMWYPTVLLNLDVKKALPEEGVRWLFVRLESKAIKNGRYDLEVMVFDAEGDIVAISNHVCYALSAARNVAVRRKGNAGESKL